MVRIALNLLRYYSRPVTVVATTPVGILNHHPLAWAGRFVVVAVPERRARAFASAGLKPTARGCRGKRSDGSESASSRRRDGRVPAVAQRLRDLDQARRHVPGRQER